ncbi:FxLYD domain-containing protein, partial [Streptacidiphilus griseoplanus]|uniref:FxLYD domain-containing protein n=1 Tax=Peterkaempfera griseoplana TaxID=66896 RepID=UPI000AE4EEFE
AAARAAASAALKTVKGRGNAVGDVQLSAVDEATAHGHPAATVKITNHTRTAASYAVQVDFADGAGKVVETAVTALDDLGPGQTATLLTFGSKASQTTTTPKVAKAERH